MAITNASRVSDFGSGIGTEGAVFQVDNTNERIGIGTTNPQAMLQVGTAVTVHGNSGIVSATTFTGALTGDVTGDVTGNASGTAGGLSGSPNITINNLVGVAATFSGAADFNGAIDVDGHTELDDVNVSGAITATTFTGNLTGDASGSSGSCTGNSAGLTGSPNITINNLVGVAATFTGEVTYEDVTNIDSVGIVTARSGIEFGAAGVGGTITAVGNAEFAGITTASKFSGPTNIPGNVTTGAYSLVAADAGKLVSADNTVTLPAATFAVGDAISVYNNTGSNMTLTCSAPTAVYLGTDGSTKTSLTLALRCICTFVCVDAGSNGSFVAVGGGLS